MSQAISRSARGALAPLLALAVVSLAVAAGPAVAGSPDQEEAKKYGQGGGYDLFVTDAKGTHFDFKGDFALPAGFFDKDSEPFEGQVALQGVPIKTFKGYKVGRTDTIVQRKNTPNFGSSYPSEAKIELEIVALSLQSGRPIQVKSYGKTQLWDVKFQLSSSRPSPGKATIIQRNERGGSFSSELTIYPSITFTRQGDRAEKTLDLGVKLPGQAQPQALTLRATDVPWERQAPRGALEVPALSDGVFVGASNRQIIPFDEESFRARHRIRIPSPLG